MRAFVMEGFGPVDNADFADMPKPTAGPDDLVVRVAAAGVNPTDWKEMRGYVAGFYPPYEGPWVPGHDGAGIVDSVGSGVTGFQPGDRVVFLSDRQAGRPSGTFAEYARVNKNFAVPAPRTLTLAEASTIPVAAATVHQALFRKDVGGAAAGRSVLIHGAAGGLGSFGVGLCAAEGLKVAATCRDTNIDYVRSLGADLVIDYKQSDIVAATKVWSPAGVDVVLDCASGGGDATLLDALAPGGRLVVIATTSHDGDIDALSAQASARGLTVHFFVLDLGTLTDTLNQISEVIDRGAMKMPEIATFPFDQTKQALSAMEAGGVRGKIAITITDLG